MFTKVHGSQHTLTPPYHPSSNGQAEISVKTFKSMFKKLNDSGLSLKEKVDEILLRYRNIPYSTTGKNPSELFLNRVPKKLAPLRPNLKQAGEESQIKSKERLDGTSPKRITFDVQQRVLVRENRPGNKKWIPGMVVQVKGSSTYIVRTPGNQRRFVHGDSSGMTKTTKTSQSNCRLLQTLRPEILLSLPLLPQNRCCLSLVQ